MGARPNWIYKQPPAAINCQFNTVRGGGQQNFQYCLIVPMDEQVDAELEYVWVGVST